MLLSALGWLVGSYLVAGICAYLYAVAKSYEITGNWYFRVYKTHIGVCTYPFWLLWWIYKITN